jgi:NADH-quinone oxidoreductase subunit G
MSHFEDKTQTHVTVYINNVAYQVSKENNLLAGVISKKINLPYFCWHPSMGSVGACRQCAVTQYQDENDTRGRLVMACTTPVKDGMRISLNDKQSEVFREQVIGAMMTNHPHDCPVCAEGGECHLQDMTVMTGHTSREYQGSKRTFNNQYLGELVGHEMNRCITCYRCTRFYNDYAGGKDFGVYGSKNQVYFGRQKDGKLESEFSGNLVEVCPTGVFTNKLFSAHYTRKWDLQSAPSICAHCSVGCNTSIGERYGSVRRVMNRYSYDLNGYFLCDRGRFGIGFVNSEQRLKKAKGIKLQSPEKLTRLDVAKTLAHLRGNTLFGIGSARASLEANFYLKELVGKESFSAGYDTNKMELAVVQQKLLAQYHPPSIKEIESCDCVLLLGEDVTKTAPRIALALRQTLRNHSIEKAKSIGVQYWQDSAVRTIGGEEHSPFFSLHSTATKLDECATEFLLISPDEIEIMVLALTNYIKYEQQQSNAEFACLATAINHDIFQDISQPKIAYIQSLTKALFSAKKPLIISGTSLASTSLLTAIDGLMACLTQTRLESQKEHAEKPQLVIVPEASNSIGLLSLIDQNTLSNEKVLEQLSNVNRAGKKITTIILEQELSSFSDEQLTQLSSLSDTVILLDHSQSKVSEMADIILPVTAISESNGHFVNYQGKVQRYYQVHPAALPIQESWRWINELAINLNKQSQGSNNASDKIIHNSLLDLHQYFALNNSDWPLSDHLAELECELDKELENEPVSSDVSIARMSRRASGRTSQAANSSVHETKITQDSDTAFRFSMEGDFPQNTADMPFSWAPGWNSNQSISQYQLEINGELEQSAPANYLTFKIPDSINACVEITSTADVKNTNCTNSNSIQKLSYFAQGSLFLDEWQSAQNPEFIMSAAANYIYLSKDFADSQGWSNGQWVKVSIDDGNEYCAGSKETKSPFSIAMLVCDKHLATDLSYGSCFEFNHATSGLNIQVTEATEKEIKHHQEKKTARYQKAKDNKEQVLAKLKENDQYIPIRLVSGGLDDA